MPTAASKSCGEAVMVLSAGETARAATSVAKESVTSTRTLAATILRRGEGGGRHGSAAACRESVRGYCGRSGKLWGLEGGGGGERVEHLSEMSAGSTPARLCARRKVSRAMPSAAKLSAVVSSVAANTSVHAAPSCGG